MIKFDKLTSDEVAHITKRVISTVGLVVAVAVFTGVASMFDTAYASLQEQNAKLEELRDEEQALSESIKEKSQAISSMKLDDSIGVISKEELVVMLGECAQEAGVDIVGLNSADAEIEDAITKYNFVFEIKGTTADIATALAGIDTHRLHYAINEMSLRQDGDYLWLQRNFDEQITWWDLSNVTATGGLQSRVNITADDIIGDNVMTLYLDLDFIFVTNTGESAVTDGVDELTAEAPINEADTVEG